MKFRRELNYEGKAFTVLPTIVIAPKLRAVLFAWAFWTWGVEW